MTNDEWKKVFKEGFAEGYAAAKKEMNYTNFPPVYYGGATSNGPIPSGPIPRGSSVGIDPRSAVMGPNTGGLAGAYAVNKPGPDHKMEPFVTGMTVQDIGC